MPNALYLGYFDDVRNVQVCGNRWQAFSNQVSLVSLLPVKTRARDLISAGWKGGSKSKHDTQACTSSQAHGHYDFMLAQ